MEQTVSAEIRNGNLYVTRYVGKVNADTPLTKWNLLSDEERVWAENTPFVTKCSGCGVMLETEADFAKHFVISDVRLFNLGTCPNE